MIKSKPCRQSLLGVVIFNLAFGGFYVLPSFRIHATDQACSLPNQEDATATQKISSLFDSWHEQATNLYKEKSTITFDPQSPFFRLPGYRKLVSAPVNDRIWLEYIYKKIVEDHATEGKAGSVSYIFLSIAACERLHWDPRSLVVSEYPDAAKFDGFGASTLHKIMPKLLRKKLDELGQKQKQ